MLGRGLAVACVLGALTLPAQAQVSPAAQPLRTVMVGNWQLGAFSKDGTRNLSYCGARTFDPSGIRMLFLLDRNYRWGLAFYNPAWRIAVGSLHDLTLAIDGGRPTRATARAAATDQVVMELADSVELFAEFRRGRVLQVTTASQTFSVGLEGTSTLLPRLLACVRNEMDVAAPGGSASQQTAAANPFARPGGPPARGSNREALVAEATVTIANLLGAAGVQGFRFGSAEEAAKLGADAVWSTGNVIGTIRILENVRVDDPQITGALIGQSAKACKGSFLSGSLPEAESEGKRTLRIFTTCQHQLKTTTVYYFGVGRPKGGIYLFATISAGPQEKVKETDSGLRTAAYQLVK